MTRLGIGDVVEYAGRKFLVVDFDTDREKVIVVSIETYFDGHRTWYSFDGDIELGFDEDKLKPTNIVLNSLLGFQKCIYPDDEIFKVISDCVHLLQISGEGTKQKVLQILQRLLKANDYEGEENDTKTR